MKRYLLKVALDHFAFGLTIPITVVWQLSRGLNIAQVGLIAALTIIVTLVADLPTGFLADRRGRKLCLLTGSAVLGLSFLSLALAHSFLAFCIYGVLSGLGWALLSGAEEAYVFETSKDESKTYRSSLSDVMITDEAATILGLAGSTLFTKYFGLQPAIVVAAGALGVAALLSLFILTEPSKHQTEISRAEKSAATGAISFLKKHKHYFVIMLIFAVYYEGGRLLWQPQLVNHGLMIYQLGVAFAIFKFFSIGGSLTAKKIALEKCKTPLIILGIILSVTFLTISSDVFAAILIGFCIYSFAENYIRVLQSDYLNTLVISHRASFLSLNNIVRNAYSASLAPLLGVIALSGVSKGFIFLAVVQLVAVVGLMMALKEKKLAGKDTELY